MELNKSYHFYHSSILIENFKELIFFNQSYFDYIFNYKTPFPKYIEQGVCDILTNKNGILFIQNVLQQFEPIQLLNDFQSCFAFNLPTEICDKDQSRYKKNFTFDFDINEFNTEVPMDLILQHEESPWKPILEIDPDFFYLRNDNQIVLGSKDYKQVENWIKEINTSNKT
jgi:hypothetical protein